MMGVDIKGDDRVALQIDEVVAEARALLKRAETAQTMLAEQRVSCVDFYVTMMRASQQAIAERLRCLEQLGARK